MVLVHRDPDRWFCGSCNSTVYKNPGPCVSILIVNDGKIVMGRRGEGEIRPGKWCLPCGYVEDSEHFIEAAKREVLEETGLVIVPEAIINAVSNHFPGNRHSMVIVLRARPVGGCFRPGDDLTKLQWVPLEGPYPDPAFKADLHIISQYVRYGDDWGMPLDQTVTEFFET